MKTEEFRERRIEVEGWPVNLTTYRIGQTWHAKADNVSPGALLARASGASSEDAEQAVVAEAAERLARTRRLAL
jgi:hypothetical protein